MFNRQFIQFARIPVEFVARLWDMSTQKYSARANIPADEQFTKDIKAIKQKAERGFVEALTKFHYRRLEKQKQKLHKEMSLANGKGRKDTKKCKRIYYRGS